MNPAFVVDASVSLTWCFKDQETIATAALLRRLDKESAAAPAWWLVETANVLGVARRKERVSDEQIKSYLETIRSIDVELVHDGPQRAFDYLLPLALKWGLTVYDALYLELAMRRRLPLATLDEPLRRAAKAAGVEVLGE